MKIKNKKVLVTGGAGFIGSHLVDQLSKNNKVVVVDDFSIGLRENLNNAIKSKNIKIIKEDIRNQEAMKKITKGIEIIFHLAALGVRASLRDPFPVHEVNASGALSVYNAALFNNIERFIHISSSEVYGSAISIPMGESHEVNPTTVYGASKLAGEFYGLSFYRTYKLPVIIVRPFNTYGPRSHFEGVYGEVIPRFVIRALNNLPPIIFGNGKQTRDFTFVKDTVKGILLAGEEEKLIGEVVNIAYGRERSIKEAAEIVLKELDKRNLGVIYQKKRPGDVKRHYADTTMAKKMLGFEAKTMLEEGVKHYINWIKSSNVDFKKALKQIQDRNW